MAASGLGPAADRGHALGDGDMSLGFNRFRNGERGFTLLEMLVVLVILSLMTAILVPMAAARIRQARLRAAVNQLTLDLRAARWTAVAGGDSVEMELIPFDGCVSPDEFGNPVDCDPSDLYEYVDVHGRTRHVSMPKQVHIVSASSPIEFKSNGSVTGGATIVVESEVNRDQISRWTIATNVLGVPSTDLIKVPK